MKQYSTIINKNSTNIDGCYTNIDKYSTEILTNFDEYSTKIDVY